jgi:gas vesicle protein
VMKVLGEVSLAMEALESMRKASATDEKGRNEQLSQKTSELVGGLSGQVDTLLSAVSEQVNKTQKNIEALENVSLRAIDGMNQGALTMGTAASRFETAGNSVTSVFDKSSKVSDHLTSSASTLQAASLAVQKGFEQYDSTRKTVDAQVAALMGLIESAKKEAGVSQELIASLKTSVDSLRQAEQSSREHLEQVNAALVKAFTDFGSAMVGQVKSTIAETDRHLSQGTGHLNGVVQELASAVQRMKRA